MMLGLPKYLPHFAKNAMLLIGIGFILKQGVAKATLMFSRYLVYNKYDF